MPATGVIFQKKRILLCFSKKQSDSTLRRLMLSSFRVNLKIRKGADFYAVYKRANNKGTSGKQKPYPKAAWRNYFRF